ncbi:MAG: hypothetical protein JOZ39_04605 [Chloroflexi bacterium]|nr:hypothetical protein [Chloroflexota bacterium]
MRVKSTGVKRVITRLSPRSLALCVCVGIASAAAILPGAALAAPQDFDVINATSGNIQNLYVSPAVVDSWLNDVLGNQIMPSGTQGHVTFKGADPSVCVYDVKIQDDQGNSGVVSGIDLCSTNAVTFTGAPGSWAYKLS